MRIIILFLLIFPSFALDYKIHQSVNYTTQSIKSGNYSIKIHRWENPGSKTWALASHGYLDHCLYLKPVMNYLIDRKYNILCYDLPGHGQSSGEKADIEKFDEYKDVLNSVLKELPKNPEKLIFIGHSTGNVGITQNLMDRSWSSPFDRVIMIAPLTRSYMWQVYQWAITEPVVKKVKWLPIVMRNSHPDYKELVKNDPYRFNKLPTNWLWELNLWFKDINQSYVMDNKELHILFGKKDTVVDHRYGKLFFEKVFPYSQIIMLKDSHHMPYYDKEKNIKEFFNILEPLL